LSFAVDREAVDGSGSVCGCQLREKLRHTLIGRCWDEAGRVLYRSFGSIVKHVIKTANALTQYPMLMHKAPT
jgi:hypothetical protein